MRSFISLTGRVSMISERKYISAQAAICPFCTSDQIEGRGLVEVEGSTAHQEVHCLECGSVWNDFYELQGYFNFTPGVTQSRCFVSEATQRNDKCLNVADDGSFS